MKRLCTILALCLCWTMMTDVSHGYEALRGPTELLQWDETRAYNGYTLFASAGQTFLIDMAGNLVNHWPIGTNSRLLENGHLLSAVTDTTVGLKGFQELDWEGNLVWDYRERREGYDPHHDFLRIFNKKLNAYTTLYIANKSITHDEAIAAGCDPDHGPYDGSQMDAIVEVDLQGNIIWEWWFFDHVVQDIDPTKANYVGAGKSIADHPGKININLPGRWLKKDWLHCNSVDHNEALDQIVINSVQGEFYVIDHGNSFIPDDAAGSIARAAGPDGDFLYRFGDPARYQQGAPPSILEDWTASTTGHKQIGGSHSVQWIRPGLPGEGHFLVFNNGQYLFERTPQSYVFEINGFLEADIEDTGDYVNPPDAGYYTWRTDSRDTHKQPKQMSNQIVWIYHSRSNQSFFSHIGSGCQRLPNGNTLICAMTEGHMFEVTPQGDIVWEYINPVTPYEVLVEIVDNAPMYNPVFRAYRYGPDHPALAGRDLTPKGSITSLGEKRATDGIWRSSNEDLFIFQKYSENDILCLRISYGWKLVPFHISRLEDGVYEGNDIAANGNAYHVRMSFTSSINAIYTLTDRSTGYERTHTMNLQAEAQTKDAADGIWKSMSEPTQNFFYQSFDDGSALLLKSPDGFSCEIFYGSEVTSSVFQGYDMFAPQEAWAEFSYTDNGEGMVTRRSADGKEQTWAVIRVVAAR